MQDTKIVGHTPGPWHYEVEDYAPVAGKITIMRDSAHLIASIPADHPQFEDTEANARLIAAAPEMYEALISLLHETSAFMGDYANGPSDKLHNTYERCLQVIAKAEGRP